MADTCVWEQEEEDCDCWKTGCGHYYCINDGTPKENNLAFCGFCGKPLEQKPFFASEDDDE